MSNIRLMIVDDQVLMRDGLKTILELEDDIDVVATAGDGKEACDLVDNVDIDVILLDIRMPVLNGVDAVKCIKEKHEDIKIVMLTTFDDEEYIVDALMYGADGYLLKDIHTDKLIEYIHDAYNDNCILPVKIAKKLAKRIQEKNVQKKEYNIKKKKFNLSNRERDIANLLAKGYTNKQISNELYISEGTVKNYISNIYKELGTSDRTKALLLLKDYK